MSVARTASWLYRSVGTALAVVVLISLAWTANAQTTNWPPSAPPLAAESGPVQLTQAEIDYYGVVLSSAVEAGKITQQMATNAFTLASNCFNDPNCTDARKTEVRQDYVSRVRNAAAEGYLPGAQNPGTDTGGGTENPGTGGGTENPPTGGGGGEGEAVGAASNSDGCNLFQGDSLLSCIMGGAGKIGASILWIFVSFCGWLLGFVGMFFNWVILVTVFQYSTYFGNSEGILLAWSILRDIGNIILLFGFIFIGLQTILNIGHFSVGRALPRLVIFAILINFSLFISEAIVDISNVFSASFYTYAGDYDCTTTASNTECTDRGIAGKLIQAAGISGILDFGEFGNNFAEIWGAPDGIQMFVLYAGMCIFLIVMMITLGAAAIMFMIRAITLMLLLVVSPLGFAGMAIPQFEEQSKKWWKMLINQSFFAPIYLLLIFVGLKIMEGAQDVFNSGGTSLLSALGSTNVTAGGIFILFALMIGFMIAAQRMASSFGAMGASFAVNTSSKIVGRATLGTAGFIGRRTVGRAAMEANNALRSSKFAQKNPGMARLLAKPLVYGQNASFDARKGISSTVGKKVGMDLGAANKTAAHGIHGIEEKAVKEREDFYKTLKPTKHQKAMSTELKAELDDVNGKRTELLKPQLARVEAARADVENARVSGDKAALNAAREQLNVELTKYESLAGASGKTDTKDMSPEDKAKHEELARLNERISKLDGRKKVWDKDAESKKMETFIEGTHHSSRPSLANLGGVLYNPYTTVGPHADHEVIDKIRKNANMSEFDRALKTIGDKYKEKDKGGDDHGGGSHGPAPAAPHAGGGGDDHGHGHA